MALGLYLALVTAFPVATKRSSHMSHRHNHLHNCSCRMLTSTATTVEKKLAANSRHFDHHAFPFREEFFHLVKFKSPYLFLITYIAEPVTDRLTLKA